MYLNKSTSGNSMIDQGEGKDKSVCDCGGDFYDIIWCPENGKICTPEQCQYCGPSEACEFAEERMKCKDCGFIEIPA